MYFDNEAPPPPSSYQFKKSTTTTTTTATTSAPPYSHLYHIHYENTINNSSRILAALITTTASNDSRPSSGGGGGTVMSNQRPNSQTLLVNDSANDATAANTGSLPDNNKDNVTDKRPAIAVYPTVAPESIVIPIVSCIFGFPLLALLIICCLRRRAKMARERDRRRNYDLQDHTVSLVRFSPIHRLTGRAQRAVSLRSERSMSRGFPSVELDTVLEERSDPEQTQIDLITPDSPQHPSHEDLTFDDGS